ncbi:MULTISPECIES: MerR family transcriptional regulator [Sphingomonadales]|jgi:MerR family mercuric resistance operon transcriptional regulator|uniref:MerR family transcriptional regulator n=1 Tax=Sphingomonadales TaxID=204457 RepID=UPI000826517A|nr:MULTISPECIES: helix-turn-helix domain-containing protein [Sphingomonadales]
MKIGVVSELTGCNIETIRYYERIGLVAAPPRRGSYRDYGPSDVDRLRFVRRGRELGFSLEEIGTLLDLAPQDGATCETVQTLAEQHLRNVRAKLADLMRIETALAELVAQCGSRPVNCCPVVESLARVY